MCYQIPGSITKDGEPIVGGLDIDPSDFSFAATIYPLVLTGLSVKPGPVVASAGSGAQEVRKTIHRDRQGVTVAVLDTGIDATHPTFKGKENWSYSPNVTPRNLMLSILEIRSIYHKWGQDHPGTRLSHFSGFRPEVRFRDSSQVHRLLSNPWL
jgi:subtilisin family serine protease